MSGYATSQGSHDFYCDCDHLWCWFWLSSLCPGPPYLHQHHHDWGARLVLAYHSWWWPQPLVGTLLGSYLKWDEGPSWKGTWFVLGLQKKSFMDYQQDTALDPGLVGVNVLWLGKDLWSPYVRSPPLFDAGGSWGVYPDSCLSGWYWVTRGVMTLLIPLSTQVSRGPWLPLMPSASPHQARCLVKRRPGVPLSFHFLHCPQ